MLKQFKTVLQQVTPSLFLANLALVIPLSLLACMLGWLYLGLPPETPEAAWELFFTRFYVIPIIAVPYNLLFTLANAIDFRKRVRKPLKSAFLMSLVDFTVVVIIYVASVLVFAPWESM